MTENELERLIMRVSGNWWHSPHMHDYLWYGLLSCRSTLHASGYSVNSKEYEALTFLLDIFHELQRASIPSPEPTSDFNREYEIAPWAFDTEREPYDTTQCIDDKVKHHA